MPERAVDNVFLHASAAERYARGRTYFHPAAIERLRDLPGIRGGLGLDVGCGTGLSSRALADLCRRVVALDPSRAMIERGARSEGVDPVVGAAERVPARASSFDVITLCQVAHWIDWTAFLDEARRVARPQGWVVVYDHYFDVEGAGASDRFAPWLREAYGGRYPRPARHVVPIESPQAWDAGGFQVRHRERLETCVLWTQANLVDYLTTQSNVIAAVEGGGETIEGAREWLAAQTKDLFTAAETRAFAFSGPIVCGQRRPEGASSSA